MRRESLVGPVAAKVVAHILAIGVAASAAIALGCRAHSDPYADATPSTRSVADVARAVGLELSESPRNASRLQAEQPAAAAVRGGEGVESLLSGGASAKTPSSGDGGSDSFSAQPSTDDWRIISQSFNLFHHAPYVVDLVLGFAFALAMGLLLTAWPKSLVARDPVEATDERNGAVIVAL
ncbi:MAG: hypothetical protein JNK53_07530, partial [Phycisphaerae bacterium]|nr:hypothetical protein [Phycisphaerae bacterium]